jgi:hypothetical protein
MQHVEQDHEDLKNLRRVLCSVWYLIHTIRLVNYKENIIPTSFYPFFTTSTTKNESIFNIDECLISSFFLLDKIY